MENVYGLQVMHALEHAQRYSFRVSGPQGLQLSADIPESVMLEPVGERLVPLAVHLPAEQAVALAGQNVPIAFHIQPEDSQEDAHAITEISRFIVPKRATACQCSHVLCGHSPLTSRANLAFPERVPNQTIIVYRGA